MPHKHRQKQDKNKRRSVDSGSSRDKLPPKKPTTARRLIVLRTDEERIDQAKTREIQYVLDVANLITPSNWNLFVTPREWSYKPGVLNIRLWVHQYSEDEEWEGPDTDSDDWIGQKYGAQRYSRISLWAHSIAEANKSLESFGDGTIGDTEIWLKEAWLGVDVLIHELAHVAVDRFQAFKQKTYKPQYPFSYVMPLLEENAHGPSFQRAYRIMINRAEKYLSAEGLRNNKSDLKSYEERFLSNSPTVSRVSGRHRKGQSNPRPRLTMSKNKKGRHGEGADPDNQVWPLI
jgi:hypothetical protein